MLSPSLLVLFFFGWGSEPGTGALWRVDRTFLFFGGLNLEQVLGRAYRKCGERGE